MPLLEAKDLHTAYGLSRVLFGVSLAVEPGEIVALLGRNGVGKSTTLRTIMGLARPQHGSVIWQGKEITGLRPHRIARLGVGYVPEDRRIFPELTVWENLDIALRPGAGEQSWDIERVCTLFPDLKDILGRKGGYLSGGQQQMLTIARSLMGNPRLLLLDEPSEGLAPLVVEALFAQINALRKEGLSMVLAEQNLEFVLSLSDRAYILEKGEVKFAGSAEELRGNEEVTRTYLTV